MIYKISQSIAYHFLLESLGNVEILKYFLDNDSLVIGDEFALRFLHRSCDSPITFDLVLFLINHPRVNINYYDEDEEQSLFHFLIDGPFIDLMMDNYDLFHFDDDYDPDAAAEFGETQTLKLAEAMLNSPKLSDAALNQYDREVCFF